ncbi:MAG: VOC family protein [Candidatus Moraniibacteriota bacterium]
MHPIIPHLWFDKEAKEAADFYVAAFGDGKITHSSTLHDTPSGDADMVSFELLGHPFMAISAGPLFQDQSVHLFYCLLQHERGSRCIVGKTH